MMRTLSRHCATAAPRFEESTQDAPRATRENVISTTALTATRPARRRSRSASLSMKRSMLAVLHQAPALEHEHPLLEAQGQPRLMRGQDDGGAARPDVFHDVDDL